VTSLKKSDVLSIVADTTRNKIVRRLDEAGKAAYSDLLDTAEHVRHLTSTGNFNYHLNFLLENSIITKDRIVYKLTEKGREIANFLKDVDQLWNKLEPTLGGERMSIFSWVEQFEEETRIKMRKDTLKFHGIELVSDERKVIGLISQEDCRKEFFKEYEPLKVEDCKLCIKKSDKESKKCSELVVSHPGLEYYISPQLLGTVHQFLETHFNEVHVFAVKKKPYPFLLRATEMGKDYNGCAFIVAPVVF
jgi:DNA-binding HxlR family transcriptional regulator